MMHAHAPAAAPRRPSPQRVPAPLRGPAAQPRETAEAGHAFAGRPLLPHGAGGRVLRRTCACGGATGPSGECDACRQKRLQRQAASAGPGVAPPIVHDVLRSPGAPLDAGTRAEMEPRFGHSFANVRVHADAPAAESARAVGAHAYAVGRSVVFGAGRYTPGSAEGRRLIAHELAHVVQQRGSASAALQPRLEIGAVDDLAEREADAAADRVLSHAPSPPRSGMAEAPRLRRMGNLALVPPAMACPVAATSTVAPLVNVRFARNSATLAPADHASIEAFIVSWRALGGTSVVRVDGFASVAGADGPNWTLSCSRAQAVAAALRTPASPTVPGIPAGMVQVFAQGETAEFPGGEAANQRATLSSAAAPPAPAPAPAPPPAPPAPPPRFVCGPNVSAEVRAAVANARTTFGGWSQGDRTTACDALDSLITGGMAWDIVELHNQSWILGYRPACASQGATPPCGSTVEIDGECSYAGSPNYVIFGVMCKLCTDHFTAAGNAARAAAFNEPGMLRLVNLYKGTGFTGLDTPSANFGPSKDWASAGFRGWPGAPGPSGDRPTCVPACRTPYSGPAFHGRWHPHGLL